MAEDILNDSGALTGMVISAEQMAIDREKMQNLNSSKMVGIMDEIYTKALNGIPKISRSVDVIVADYMSKYSNARTAAKELAKYQIAKCGTTGFITGLGGILTLPVAIPANVGRVLYVQIRMIAAIAKMGGFDIHSDQVQTLVYACLTGNAVADVIKNTGIRVGEKVSESVITRIPAKVLTMVNEKIGFKMITQFGSEGALNLMELVPVAGGVIGGAIDVASTKIVADNAISIFIDKKIPEEKKKVTETIAPLAKKGSEALDKAMDFAYDSFTSASAIVKSKYDEALSEMKLVKMTVKEVAPGKLEEGKVCHVIVSPKKILLSWDYFIDENGNKYLIEKAVSVPSAKKKNTYEYHVDFADQEIELPKGTILLAGEDKWRKKLPDCDISGIVYSTAYTPVVEAVNDSEVTEPAMPDITIKLADDGILCVDRKSKATTLKYKLGRKMANKVFDDLRDCITAGESGPVDSGDAFERLLILQFENGEEVAYTDVRGMEKGTTTKDIIHKLLKAQGLNCTV